MTLPVVLGLVLAAGSFALATALPSSDPDLYWHLASAKWMVDHGGLLTRDPFSHTAAGAPYSVGEWLGELAWFAAYRLGEWQGIAVLRGLLVAITTFFATRAGLLVQPRPSIAILPLLAALAISKTTWTDRPQLFTLALFAVFFFVLLRAHLAGGARAIWILPPLLLLWTNLHGGYALGLVLSGLFALAAFVERRPHAKALVAALVLSAGLSALNPASLGPLGAVGHAASPPRFIVEELPPDLFSAQGATFGALLLATLASALVAGSLGALWPIVLIPLAWLGLSAQRHLAVAAIAFAAYVALAGPLAVERVLPRARQVAARRLSARPAIGTFLALALLASSIGSARAAPSAPDESAYPRGALAALSAARGNLLNEYDWGGYLIWNAPDHPVFIDGRLFLFLPDVFADYQEASGLGPRFRDVLERRRIDVVLLRPSRPLAVFLRETGWQVRAEDRDRFVLLMRP